MNWNAKHADDCTCDVCRARETVVQDTEFTTDDVTPLAGSDVKAKWYAAMVDGDDTRNDRDVSDSAARSRSRRSVSDDDEYVKTPEGW